MNVKEIGCEDVEWIYLAQDRIQCLFYEYANEPFGSIKKTKL
jgi:hypothetical protein